MSAAVLLTVGVAASGTLPAVRAQEAPDAPESSGPAGGSGERTGNRLAVESSPYLLQHAQNPVDWHPWGEAAFRKARDENKLIFLSIGYSTCYWCHVMEREVFADTLTAEKLNAGFVSIMVDREERPDVDRIYMRVRVMMSGQGGWPLSVFLTPDLEPLLATGNMPKAQFNKVLNRIHDGWTTQEARYRQHAAKVAQRLERSSHLPGEAESHELPSGELLTQAVDVYARQFDTRYGGFNRRSKFPRPAILEMLMAAAERGEPEPSLTMVVKTLTAMARGGIHDHLGGGFHRYAMDRAWQAPHFEKMLYDNAQLLHAYVRAYKLTGNDEFRRVAQDIVGYLQREMTDHSGLFYAAQDSETEGEEGAYYLWEQRELETLLSEAELALISSLYGLAPLPGSEGKHVLTLAKGPQQAAEELGLTVVQLARRREAVRHKLLAARSGRKHPFRDEKVIASWNGLMIEALAYAGGALDRPDYLSLAERAARSLLRTLTDGQGSLLHVALDGQAKIPAYLDDYAAVILGLTELYRASGNALWRNEAARLADQMVARLYDEENGGFFDTSPGTRRLIGPLKETSDGAMPAGNSMAARALHGLAAEGLDRFTSHARYVFSAYAPTLETRPHALPYMLWALEEFYRDGLSVLAEPAAPRGTAEVVRIAARLASDNEGSTVQSLLVVALDIDEGWHVNANPASFDFLVPTTVSAEIGGDGRRLDPAYPSGKTLKTPLGPLAVYEDAMSIQFVLPAAVEDGQSSGSVVIQADLQACNESGICLPPETLDLALHF